MAIRLSAYLFVTVMVMLLASCAINTHLTKVGKRDDSSSEELLGVYPADKFERINRKIFAFNDWFDRNLLVPIAKGYIYITPDGVERGIANVFSNLSEPVSFVNNTLQADFVGAGTSLFRFVVNSIFGIYGVYDVATNIGMDSDKEDFGQTLGHWGVGSGSYIVLPFFGPSTTRDMFSYADGLYYNAYWPFKEYQQGELAARGLSIVQFRASLLEIEKSIIGDRYTFLRDAYLQRREYVVHDGVMVHDDFGGEEDALFEDLDDEF